MEERIKLEDNVHSMISKMSDGNPGAIDALLQILKSGHIDPLNPLGGVGSILLLDTFGIYGTDIYVLYNDICDRNLTKTIAVLRATQLGILDRNTLKRACGLQDRSGRGIILADGLYIAVKEQLSEFDPEGIGVN